MSKTKIARLVTASLAILAVVRGVVVGEFGYGGICSFSVWMGSVTSRLEVLLRPLGVWRIKVTFTCPLGFLQRCLASRQLLPQWPSVVLVVLSVILLGRVFCAWVCPTVLLRRVFRDTGGLKSKREAAPKGVNWASYSPYAVLGGVLFTSFLFRFPVFCYFCPIGLFFGFLFAVLRLFSPHSLSLELVLFPLMLGLELWVLKSWCRSLCPLGALLSIIGNLNRFLLPTVRKDRCLTSKGANCEVCERVCPEGIDLVNLGSSYSSNSCTKCLECYEKCPARAIRIAILK
jgi:ferredoxin-type protein NapH